MNILALLLIQTLSWTAATDNVTPPASLVYEVRQSVLSNLDTVAAAEANGVVVRAYGAATSFTPTLTPGLTTWFNVLVKDQADNKAAYRQISLVDAVIDVIAPVITYQPVSQTVRAGQPVTFAVVASGTAPLTYQWYRTGTSIPGATAWSYSLVATKRDNNTTYAVTVSNAAGSVVSSSAALRVRR